MTFWISALLFATGLGAGLRKRWQRAFSRRRRQLEKPNSYYSAPGVRSLLDLERWERIPLHGLHPVNRGEAERLRLLARTAGPHRLSAAERRFLDNMVPSG